MFCNGFNFEESITDASVFTFLVGLRLEQRCQCLGWRKARELKRSADCRRDAQKEKTSPALEVFELKEDEAKREEAHENG